MINLKLYKNFIRLVVRSLPIFFLFLCSFYVSLNYPENIIFNYEFQTRIIGLGISLLSAPFFNTFLFGYQRAKTKKWHNFFVVAILVISFLSILFLNPYKVITFSVTSAYLIRIIVVLNSTSKGRSMNYFEMFVFYFSLVIFYPLLLFENVSSLALLVILLLISFIYYSKINKVSLMEKNKKDIYLGLNSFSGILFNNYDLVVSKLIGSENFLGLALLYSKRIANVFELISQTFIQSLKLNELKTLKKFFIYYIPIGLLTIIILHKFFLNLFMEYNSYNIWICMFLLIFGLRSSSTYFERYIFENKGLKTYSIVSLFIAILLSFLLMMNLDWEFMFGFYLFTIFTIILIRLYLFKIFKNE